MYRFLVVWLRCCWLVFLLNCGSWATPPLSESSVETRWFDVPKEALLLPSSPFVSDCFDLIRSETDSVHLLFRCKSREGNLPGNGERFRCVVAIPSGGIRSATYERSVPVLLKGGERVEKATATGKVSFSDRLTAEPIGEFRGAKLVQVEFRPVYTVSGVVGVDSALVETATIHLYCASPFISTRSLNPLLTKTLSPFVVNATDLSGCLPPKPRHGDPPIPGTWLQPALKIRTQEEGWYRIPAKEVMDLLGSEIPAEALRLTRRAPIFSLDIGSEIENKEESGIPATDQAVSLFIRNRQSETKMNGLLQPEDELLFHAPQSTSPTDPQHCFWLSLDSRTTKAEHPLHGDSAGLPVCTTGIVRLQLGEDRIFAEGGERTLRQARFWVDCVFEQDHGNEISLPLPDEWTSSSHPVLGTFHLLFGSTLKESYSQEDHLKPNDCAILVGDSTCAYVQSPGNEGIGFELRFAIQPGQPVSSLVIKYQPETPPKNPLYLDSLELSMSQALIWQGSNCVYSWPAPVSGTFEIGSSQGLPLPQVFAMRAGGEWLRLEPRLEDSTLRVACPDPIQELHLVSRFHSVEQLSRYNSPEWLTHHPSLDQLVISPLLFKKSVRELIELDEKRGFRSAWIDLEQIFDLFSGGQFSPFAVKNFLGWVERVWDDPQPFSVMMIGDSTWDYWDRYRLASKAPNWTPSLHTDIHSDYPNDLWFIEGAPEDRIGNWFWGRFPCQTIQQMEDYLAKRSKQIDVVRDNIPPRLIWVTDDNPPFEKHSTETFLQSLPLSYRLDHIRIRDYPFVDNFYYGIHLLRIREEARKASAPLDYGKISPECNHAIRDSLSRGGSLFIYFGHSGLNVLGHERVLFGGGSKFSDIPSLTNQTRAPLAFMMTCDVGRFDYVEIPKWSVGLAEEMLFTPHGGCMGLVTSSGRGLPSDHVALLKSCLDLHTRAGISEFGAILWGGKIQCLLAGMPNQAVEMFNLLGDPLDRIQSLPTQHLLQKGLKWNRDGSLSIRFSLMEELPDARIETCWQVGDELREDFSWNEVNSSSTGVFEITLPDARDLKKLLLAAQIESTSLQQGALIGWLGVNLEKIPRPSWNDPQSGGLPNLVISADRIHFEKESPRCGETIFLQASVVNDGTATARDVLVAAYSSNDKPLPNFANYPEARIVRLLPGEEKKVRLRWDLWEGTGLKEVIVKVDPDRSIHETNESDNEARKSIRIHEKADLGWGLISGATDAHVDFSRLQPAPAAWVIDPTRTELGGFAPFRTLLANADRAAILEVPLCNFGETRSVTCSLLYRYWGGEGDTILFETEAPRIAPLEAVTTPLQPKSVPILLVPGVRKIEIEVDPDGIVDESTRDNNILWIEPPATLWDRLPMQREKRSFPEALKRF